MAGLLCASPGCRDHLLTGLACAAPLQRAVDVRHSSFFSGALGEYGVGEKGGSARLAHETGRVRKVSGPLQQLCSIEKQVYATMKEKDESWNPSAHDHLKYRNFREPAIEEVTRRYEGWGELITCLEVASLAEEALTSLSDLDGLANELCQLYYPFLVPRPGSEMAKAHGLDHQLLEHLLPLPADCHSDWQSHPMIHVSIEVWSHGQLMNLIHLNERILEEGYISKLFNARQTAAATCAAESTAGGSSSTPREGPPSLQNKFIRGEYTAGDKRGSYLLCATYYPYSRGQPSIPDCGETELGGSFDVMLNGRRLLGEDLKTLPFCESEQARGLLQAQGEQPSLIKEIPAAVWGRWHGTLWLKGDWPLDNSKAYLKHGKAAQQGDDKASLLVKELKQKYVKDKGSATARSSGVGTSSSSMPRQSPQTVRSKEVELQKRALEFCKWLHECHRRYDEEVEFLYNAGEVELIKERPGDFICQGIRHKGKEIKARSNRAGGGSTARDKGMAVKIKENPRLVSSATIWGECVGFVFFDSSINVRWESDHPNIEGGVQRLQEACRQATTGKVQVKRISSTPPPVPDDVETEEFEITSIFDYPSPTQVAQHCLAMQRQLDKEKPKEICLNDEVDRSRYTFLPLTRDEHEKVMPQQLALEQAWASENWIALYVKNHAGKKMLKNADGSALSLKLSRPGRGGGGLELIAPKEPGGGTNFFFKLPQLPSGTHKFEAQLTSGGPKAKFEITVLSADKAATFEVEWDGGLQELSDHPVGTLLPPVNLKAKDVAGNAFELPAATFDHPISLTGSSSLRLAGEAVFGLAAPDGDGVRAVRCTGLRLDGKLSQRMCTLAFSWGDYAAAGSTTPSNQLKVTPAAGIPTQLVVTSRNGYTLGELQRGTILPALTLLARDEYGNACTGRAVYLTLERDGISIENECLLFDNSLEFPQDDDSTLALTSNGKPLNLQGRFRIAEDAPPQAALELVFSIWDEEGHEMVRSEPSVTFSVEDDEVEVDEVEVDEVEVEEGAGNKAPTLPHPSHVQLGAPTAKVSLECPLTAKAGEPFWLEVHAFSEANQPILLDPTALSTLIPVLADCGGGGEASLTLVGDGWQRSPGANACSVRRHVSIGCRIDEDQPVRSFQTLFRVRSFKLSLKGEGEAVEQLAAITEPTQVNVEPGTPAGVRVAEAAAGVAIPVANTDELTLNVSLVDAYGSITKSVGNASHKWMVVAGEDGTGIDGFKQPRGASTQLKGRVFAISPPGGEHSVCVTFGSLPAALVPLRIVPGRVPCSLRIATAADQLVSAPLVRTAQHATTLPAQEDGSWHVSVLLEDGNQLESSDRCSCEYWIQEELKIKSKEHPGTHSRTLDGLRLPTTASSAQTAYVVTVQFSVTTLGRDASSKARLALLQKVAPEKLRFVRTLELLIQPGSASKLQLLGGWPDRYRSSHSSGSDGWANMPTSPTVPMLRLTDEFDNVITDGPAAEHSIDIHLEPPVGAASNNDTPPAALITQPITLRFSAGCLPWAEMVKQLSLTSGGRTGTYALRLCVQLPGAATAAEAAAAEEQRQLVKRHKFMYIDPAQSHREHQELEMLRLEEGQLTKEVEEARRAANEADRRLETCRRKRDEAGAEHEAAAVTERSKRQRLDEAKAQLGDAKARVEQMWPRWEWQLRADSASLPEASTQLRNVLTKPPPHVTLALVDGEPQDYTEDDLTRLGTVVVNERAVPLIVRPITPELGQTSNPLRKGVYVETAPGSGSWQRRGSGVLETTLEEVLTRQAVHPEGTLCHVAQAHDGRVSQLLMGMLGGDVALLRSDATAEQLATLGKLLLSRTQSPLGFMRGLDAAKLEPGVRLDADTHLLEIDGSVHPPDAAAAQAAYLANLVHLPEGEQGVTVRFALYGALGKTVALLAPAATVSDLTHYSFHHNVPDVVLLGPHHHAQDDAHDLGTKGTATEAAPAPPFVAILRGVSTSIIRLPVAHGSLSALSIELPMAELDGGPSGSSGSVAATDAAGAQLISEIDEDDEEDQIEIRMLHTAAAASFGAPASQAPFLDAGSTLTQALGATAPGHACLELLRARREHCAAASEVVRLGSALTPLKVECQSIQQEHTRAEALASEVAAALNTCRKRLREIDEAHRADEAGPSELEAARGFMRVAHRGAVTSDGQEVQSYSSPATFGNGEPRSRRRLDPG